MVRSTIKHIHTWAAAERAMRSSQDDSNETVAARAFDQVAKFFLMNSLIVAAQVFLCQLDGGFDNGSRWRLPRSLELYDMQLVAALHAQVNK
jgi:hypothetical protein